MIQLGIDAGNGAFKIYGANGGVETLSQVAINGGNHVAATFGMTKATEPLNIVTSFGSFYVGAGAHDYGRPVENLDVERFNGTPEMLALFYGAMTDYQAKFGQFVKPLSLMVGLPQEILTKERKEQTIADVNRWMRGKHQYTVNGETRIVAVENVRITSQPFGGLSDYLLDDFGKFIPERKKAATSEVGIISVGFGTVELLAVRGREQLQRFTSGNSSGVRRMLEILNSDGLYSLGEMDIQLRAGQLDTSKALPVWEREVTGIVEKQWGKAWRRFNAVLLMGGGAILLKDLPLKFNGKGYRPDEPVMSIARGLYKLTQMSSRK